LTREIIIFTREIIIFVKGYNYVYKGDNYYCKGDNYYCKGDNYFYMGGVKEIKFKDPNFQSIACKRYIRGFLDSLIFEFPK
jgi:hypothetical protein